MTRLVVTAVLWAGVGVGVVILAAGIRGRRLFTGGRWRRWEPSQDRRLVRPLVAVAAAVVALAVTRLVAVALIAAAVVWLLPKLRSNRAERDAAIARTEAVAAWTEMVRDSIVAASGLEEAIAATGPVAPGPIAPEVRALVRRLDPRVGLRLDDALQAFGAEMHHPSADLVVASLVLAARMEVSDLSGLLTRLAEAIRDDARMRIRVEVGRTRVRTAAKVIIGAVAATMLLLGIVNLDYLEVYRRPGGQVVLLVVAGIFALGAWLLERMAAIDLPERFTARTTSDGGSPWS